MVTVSHDLLSLLESCRKSKHLVAPLLTLVLRIVKKLLKCQPMATPPWFSRSLVDLEVRNNDNTESKWYSFQVYKSRYKFNV